MSDRLKTDLYTIWDRGRHGISWDDSWVQDFIDDLGEVVRWCRVHEAKASARWDECHVAGRLRGREEDCSIVVDLRISVSDGGEDRP